MSARGVPQEQPAEFVAAFPGATENDIVAQAGQPVTADGVTTTSTALNTAGQYVVLLDPSFRFTSDRIAWINKVG